MQNFNIRVRPIYYYLGNIYFATPALAPLELCL